MFAVCAGCNGAHGISDMEGKVTSVGASECGQRASFNRDRDLADEPNWCSSVLGCRNARGLANRIEIGYHRRGNGAIWAKQTPAYWFSAASRNELVAHSYHKPLMMHEWRSVFFSKKLLCAKSPTS